MIRAIILLAALLISSAASAQLSTARLQTLCTACKANTTCNAARAADTTSLLAWLNGPKSDPTTLGWRVDMAYTESDEAATYTTYDTLAAGKRDSWDIFLRAQSRNYGRNKVRAWVVDVWGNATGGSVSEAILQAATFPSTNAQFAIGGVSRSTGTVTALDLAFAGQVSQADAIWLANPANCN